MFGAFFIRTPKVLFWLARRFQFRLLCDRVSRIYESDSKLKICSVGFEDTFKLIFGAGTYACLSICNWRIQKIGYKCW